MIRRRLAGHSVFVGKQRSGSRALATCSCGSNRCKGRVQDGKTRRGLGYTAAGAPGNNPQCASDWWKHRTSIVAACFRWPNHNCSRSYCHNGRFSSGAKPHSISKADPWRTPDHARNLRHRAASALYGRHLRYIGLGSIGRQSN